MKSQSLFLSSVIILLWVGPSFAQVLDVNGDLTVGAEEALAVAEQWKGPASRPNDHNHLGQTWLGNNTPLVIRGNFPGALPFLPLKGEGIQIILPPRRPAAPLVLDNTATEGNSPSSDLILGGDVGKISANQHSSSSLVLSSYNEIDLLLDVDQNNDDLSTSLNVFGNGELPVVQIFEEGSMTLFGTLTELGLKVRMDHPSDPASKYLQHSGVHSPDMMNIYNGNVTLDENGDAEVHLPDYFEALNADFRYQLTCIGGFAPVYVAEEINDNRFQIAGGSPGMTISWQVTGIRQDAYAKANPIEVEQEKSEEEKGEYLHPELFGEPVEKSVMRVSED